MYPENTEIDTTSLNYVRTITKTQNMWIYSKKNCLISTRHFTIFIVTTTYYGYDSKGFKNCSSHYHISDDTDTDKS